MKEPTTGAPKPPAGATSIDPRAEALLRQPVLGQLAFNGHDGRPRVLPIWFLYEGGDLLMGSQRHAYKNRCLSADPRASFAVVSSAPPYHEVTMLADAIVETVSDEERNRFIENVSTRYLGAEGSRLYVESWHKRRQPDDGGRIRLRPFRVRFKVAGVPRS
jgi:nitroimidazol reductase NimA-like FMN-containing flavoprotein (pyridoxamine 5'-phosphate oxidase superfamily)